MNTGERIARLRADAGMSQEALADSLCVARSLVTRWENGTRRPDRRSVDMMASMFGTDPGSIAPDDPLVRAELSECLASGCPDVGSAEAVALMNEFMAGLGERERNIFLRRYHFFERPAEIAERYGLSKGAVRISLHRSRKKLRSFLVSASGKE